MNFDLLKPYLDQALASRHGTLDSASDTAFRLFNGFYEGYPSLALDVYAKTLLIHDYSDEPNQEFINQLVHYLRERLDWLHAGVLKTRNAKTPDQKRGQILFGDNPDKKIREHGFWYAIDLTMNRDASFYLDTSNLRKWLIENSKDKTVLNTFAYTGSLGVATMAGGAIKVVQTDRHKGFLNLAKDSYSLNNFSIQKQNFIAQDFFPVISRFKTGKQTFDCVIIDPPIFSSTSKGKVDLENESIRLINKVRPLINDGGYLISINNGVYVSGKEYMQVLETICKDGYLNIRELIPVQESFIGYQKIGKSITDPTPFNHSTKIAILDVKKK
ncbi:MAG TPA: SAM-dependent methyltransferase [Anaerolineae bacterium]|nr:SAM-dependent methyltransferase [Anaerolineae bacterium]HCK66509.1 SAM-dependent methyltransferase [Anaerolineae bacterium]